jgi:hypothetical protein
LKLCIADPPYLGRAVRWYGAGGIGYTAGQGQADNHPEAHIWDNPETHKQLARDLLENYDGFAIAMSVHSLSTYLDVIETEDRNGIRVCVWHKNSALPSANRVQNNWEPVIVKIPQNRRAHKSGLSTKDVFTCAPLRSGFVGSKPPEWTRWVLDLLGYKDGDEVIDLFEGSGAVSRAINQTTLI